MPLYEYHCRECGNDYDEYRSLSERDKAGECPKCGSRKTSRSMATLLKGASCSVGASGGFT